MGRKLIVLAAGLLVGIVAVNAQTQTWDPDGNSINDGGAGTWNTTSNFWLGGTTWVNGNNAVFGNAGANYTVNIADGGVTVGDLTYEGTHTLWLKSVTDNLGTIAIKSGGATWNTGGGSIRFLNNQVNDTPLSISSGDTLTVAGGGQFDTGEKPVGATWSAAGATLDVTEATVVRGHAASIGQFNTVKLAGGSTYVHERNSGQTYANNWVLGAGDMVRFGNRFSQWVQLSGEISGAGGLDILAFANKEFTLLNDNNSFSGGIKIGSASRLKVNNASRLGSADNDITLSDGGILKAEGINFGSSRQIILDGTGGSIINAGVNSFGGTITGDGNLQIGNSVYGGNVNTMTLSGNSDYTGSTRIERGTLMLGVDETLPAGTVVTIGGGGSTSRLAMNGYDQTIGGLAIAGSNTRVIRNNSTTDSTLTINVADGQSYSYSANVEGSGTINLVKTGAGSQTISRTAGFTTAIGDLAANGGNLIWNVASGEIGGAVSVGASGTLQVGAGGTTGTIDNKNVANEGSLVIARSDATSYNGVISGNGSVKLTGGGVMTLGAAQTYSGDTTLEKGQIKLTADNQLSSDTVVHITGSNGGTSALQLNGKNVTVGGVRTSGTNTKVLNNAGGTASTLTLDVADGASYTYGGNVNGADTVNIVKTGLGTQAFNRGSNFSTALGTITVNGGELVWNVSGAAAHNGASVGSGGTLSGSGTLNGAVTVAGNLNPGNSPGTLTFNDALTLESTATLNLELMGINAGEFDVLLNDGGDTLTVGGTLAFDASGLTATNGQSFLVFDNWGGFAGSFSSVTGTDLGGGLSLDTTDLLSTGTVTVIPEPATLGLVIAMGGGLFWIRRVFMV